MRIDPLLTTVTLTIRTDGNRASKQNPQYTVEKDPQMETIQVVLDAELLRAADLAAKRQKVNRSALIREALERHLKRLHELELETQDRRATWLIRSAAKNTACGGTRRRGPSIKPRRCPSVRIREAGQTAAGS